MENKQEGQVNYLLLLPFLIIKIDSSSPLGELFDHGCDAMTSVVCYIFKIKNIQ